jgi:flagellar FliJ protein
LKAFRFNLERVGKVRALQAGACRTRLSQETARVEHERRSLDRLEGMLQSCYQRYLAGADGPVDLETLRQYRREYAGQLAGFHSQARSLSAAQQLMETRRAELVEAERRRKVMVRLRERRLWEHQRAGEQQDQKDLDEVGSLRHHRRVSDERR